MNSVCLVILDGWGYAPNWGGNPISVARPQVFNSLWRTYPKTLLEASGSQVGLPGHEAGNSEVGHLNIGTGRIVRLDQTAITASIRDGQFFQNEVLLEAFHRARHNHSSVHLVGLVSDGGVHSYLDHIYALLELAVQQKVDRVYIHMFTDGRDSPPQSALGFLAKLEQAFNLYKLGLISTVSGRFFAMDRDRHYDRTQKVIDVMLKSAGPAFPSARQAIASSYKQGLSDEYIIPCVITRPDGNPVGPIGVKDSVILFNFRADRARQLTAMFLEQMPELHMVTFIPYGFEKELKLPLRSVFKPQPLHQSLTEVISQVGLQQFHIAETEKYAHVTYFFNGGIEDPFPGEERLLVASPKVISFDARPEMSAREITAQVAKRITSQRYGFFIINYANADMVGHTGNIKAAMQAIWVIDEQIKTLYQACLRSNTHLIITADHGNVEQMIDPVSGETDTEHSTNPVPFILAAPETSVFRHVGLRSSGVLADIAPTILAIIGLQKPPDMSGTALQENLESSTLNYGKPKSTSSLSYP